MKFIPNSPIKSDMLNEIGLSNIDELFSDIPKKIRVKKLHLSDGLSQQDVETHLRKIGNKNKPFTEIPSFLVSTICERSELCSAEHITGLPIAIYVINFDGTEDVPIVADAVSSNTSLDD